MYKYYRIRVEWINDFKAWCIVIRNDVSGMATHETFSSFRVLFHLLYPGRFKSRWVAEFFKSFVERKWNG